MKILIINGSGHKGNTWKLVEQANGYLKKLNGEIEFEEIHLIKENLPFCIGCSNCFRVGHEKCPHYSIVGKIIQKMENADGMIFASTTYNMRETALLKNLFDHLCFMLHRPHFFRSKALVITTTGGVGGSSSAKSISSTLKGIGFNRCYLFSRATFSWNAYEPDGRTLMALNKKVSKFYKDVNSGKLHSPDVSLLIPYNLFRGMSLAYIPGTEYETQDGVYWTEACRRKSIYAPGIKVSFYKKPIGYIFYGIGKIAGKMKGMLVTYKK